ncbi:hypothetical protein VTK73DRAFT_1903 [Phialemonium thermophilum]|uniref:Uncharacterized protein n=1 Tax=Phialemonium thermophilum TaxID=223376 RepID=A0ABR3Y2W3_9PEZI
MAMLEDGTLRCLVQKSQFQLRSASTGRYRRGDCDRAKTTRYWVAVYGCSFSERLETRPDLAGICNISERNSS